MDWHDILLRTVRTFAQAFLGQLLLSWAAVAVAPGTVPSFATLQGVGVAALIAGAVATVTFLHNLLEQASGVSLPAK